MPRILGCIADDYTGATDLSSMLVRAGLRVIQCFGSEELDAVNDQLSQADAVVVALKSRSIPPCEAIEKSLAALNVLQKRGFERIFFKYCSTFDSTAQGNIGPVANALANALNSQQTIFCPAFPENERTVYSGYLFVGGVPLAESGMRNHPLNPMTDSNLVRVLQAQTSRSVGRLPIGQPLPDDGQFLIADAICESDLRHVASVANDHTFLTGGSAIARYWAEEIRSSSPIGDKLVYEDQNGTSKDRRCIVLAGSCSDATRTQIATFRSVSPTLDIQPSIEPQVVADQVLDWCEEKWSSENDSALLVCSGAKPEFVSEFRECFGEQHASNLIEEIFAIIAAALANRGVRRFVVAGGETSGAVINALGIRAVRIGSEIATGVPLVHSINPNGIRLALKSGNFGDDDFFSTAVEALK